MPQPAESPSSHPADTAPAAPRVPMSGRRVGATSRAPRWLWLALLLAVAGTVLWHSGGRDWRQWRPQPQPQARTQALLDEAAAALERGHLSASDGSGARELYAAVRALDPDEGRARQGLVMVGRAALAAAREALARNDVALAQECLHLARELQAPRTEREAVADALRRHALAQVPVEVLLERAEAARRAGQWLPDEGETSAADDALTLYQQILALHPGHAAALRGREDVLAEVLDGARAHLRAGDLDAAARALAAARRFDPGHVDLPDTVARFTEERAALRQQAGAALASREVTAALALWQRLLALDENDAQAREGIARAALGLAERAAAWAEAGRFAEADDALSQARELTPHVPAIRAAELRIARARQNQPATQTHPPALQALSACFDAALAANQLRRAGGCLQAASAQGEGVAVLAARRRQLALRWLALAEERLRRGELSAAASALETARQTDAATPGLDAFAQRLGDAGR